VAAVGILPLRCLFLVLGFLLVLSLYDGSVRAWITLSFVLFVVVLVPLRCGVMVWFIRTPPLHLLWLYVLPFWSFVPVQFTFAFRSQRHHTFAVAAGWLCVPLIFTVDFLVMRLPFPDGLLVAFVLIRYRSGSGSFSFVRLHTLFPFVLFYVVRSFFGALLLPAVPFTFTPRCSFVTAVRWTPFTLLRLHLHTLRRFDTCCSHLPTICPILFCRPHSDLFPFRLGAGDGRCCWLPRFARGRTVWYVVVVDCCFVLIVVVVPFTHDLPPLLPCWLLEFLLNCCSKLLIWWLLILLLLIVELYDSLPRFVTRFCICSLNRRTIPTIAIVLLFVVVIPSIVQVGEWWMGVEWCGRWRIRCCSHHMELFLSHCTPRCPHTTHTPFVTCLPHTPSPLFPAALHCSVAYWFCAGSELLIHCVVLPPRFTFVVVLPLFLRLLPFHPDV